jgi:predicted metal-dependent hydrolase
VYDLREIFDRLNKRYFSGKLKATIEWSRRGRASSNRTQIRHGTCTAADGLIRIHPDLDCAWVPPWFVTYIVYHEMLHLKLWPATERGRTVFHTPQFYAAEKRFGHYQIAHQWERKNINALLGC